LYPTYRVSVAPDQIQYDVRDRIYIDGNIYYIREVIQSMEDIELLVDTGKVSELIHLDHVFTELRGTFLSVLILLGMAAHRMYQQIQRLQQIYLRL